MKASEEAMYITPDAETIEKLDALRMDGESFSDIVARLADDRMKKQLDHGDAVFHIKLVPELREAVDEVRREGETYATAIARAVRAPLTIHFSKEMWEKLDKMRGGGEMFGEVIERLVKSHQNKMDTLDPELRATLDNFHIYGEPYAETITRLVKEHKAVMNETFDPLTPKTFVKLDALRDGVESYDAIVNRTIKAYQQAEGVRVGELTPDLWQKLDEFRSNDETYVSVINHLIQSRKAVVASQELRQLVHLTKSMRNDLDVIIDGNETQVGVIARLIKEHLTIKQQQAFTPLGSTSILRVKPTSIQHIVNMMNPGEDYDAFITRLMEERNLFREIAEDMASEGRRMARNQRVIVDNFKFIIRELTSIDKVLAENEEGIIWQDVDFIIDRLTAAPPTEEGDNK